MDVLQSISKEIRGRSRSFFAQLNVDKLTILSHNIKNAEIYDKSNKVDLEISIRLQIIVYTNYSEKNTTSWKQDSLS